MMLEELGTMCNFLFCSHRCIFMETSSFWNKGKPCFYAPLCNFIRDLILETFGGGEKVGDGRISVPHKLSKKQARIALPRNRKDHLFS